MPTVIKKTKRGFTITRKPCVVCGEPPFGDEYACGHSQESATEVSQESEIKTK